MDPQRRGLLEATYRVLENAGIHMGQIKVTKTSIHVGSFTSDFNTMICQSVTSDILCTPAYWVQKLVFTVNFDGAMRKCCSGSIIRPNPGHFLVLGQTERIGYPSVLNRDRPAINSLLASIGGLHCQGFPLTINKANLLDPNPSRPYMSLIGLPEYPFNHSVTYWDKSQTSKQFRFRKNPRHHLLGCQVLDWNPLEPKWRHIVRLEEMPRLEDNKINGFIIFPAAGMIAMAIEAMNQLSEGPTIVGFDI
ncbi:Highly reducing polyketide synthase FUM1 [Lachnellula suecica]|uniref:Highly reducing polyketide synthase FUM1 n=1 Tax=Lachnellula suecica TaxID=602035 RepID=A0A8T9C1T9_9HELO|nr:Highly reducing polyketide synthase FUM1 [Lachnellula suecica]